MLEVCQEVLKNVFLFCKHDGRRILFSSFVMKKSRIKILPNSHIEGAMRSQKSRKFHTSYNIVDRQNFSMIVFVENSEYSNNSSLLSRKARHTYLTLIEYLRSELAVGCTWRVQSFSTFSIRITDVFLHTCVIRCLHRSHVTLWNGNDGNREGNFNEGPTSTVN